VPTGKIASGQAFFLNGLSNGVATYRNSMRLVGDNTQFFRMQQNQSTSPELEKHRVWIDLIGNETNYKQALIGYCENATDEIDRGFDSTILASDNPINIYSLLNTTKLSIQGKALPFDVNDRVPLGFVTATNGNYRIRLFNFDGLFETQNIYLEDKLLNVIHDLKESDYSFVSNAGVFENRFELIFLNSTLSNPQSSWDENAVVVYMPADELMINSGTVVMDNVKVYDIRGRLITEKKEVNSVETSIDLGRSNGVYLIQITSSEGQVVTKKYMK
jgi:hypothetical protein